LAYANQFASLSTWAADGLLVSPGTCAAYSRWPCSGRRWLLPPLAVATWALLDASCVRVTVAGVLLGFTVPVFASFAGGVAVGGRSGLCAALLAGCSANPSGCG
jgi:hypothetical protein